MNYDIHSQMDMQGRGTTNNSSKNFFIKKNFYKVSFIIKLLVKQQHVIKYIAASLCDIFNKSLVSKNIDIICWISNKVSIQSQMSLYYSLVHPYYQYCNIIWDTSHNVILEKLIISQKKAIICVINSN